MIVFEINPIGGALTADECCEALVGVQAFRDNDIVVSEAPERGDGAFDIILGGYKDGDEPNRSDLTISFTIKKGS